MTCAPDPLLLRESGHQPNDDIAEDPADIDSQIEREQNLSESRVSQMSDARIGRRTYESIGGFLIFAIAVGGVLAFAGMIHTWELDNTFAEFLLVFILAAEGAYAWVHFHQARAEGRTRLLKYIYAEFDTEEARQARKAIYDAKPEQLRKDYLHNSQNTKERERVESTIASLERLAYRILNLGVEGEDAFQYCGGVLLQVTHKVWPYILEQRKLREEDPDTHKMLYRRFLEELVRKWVPKYAKEIRREPLSYSPSTEAMLNAIFSPDSSSAGNGRSRSTGGLARSSQRS
jgi:hypothetical protein